MEVRKYKTIDAHAADMNGNNDFESGKYIAVVDVLGKIKQSAAFVQKLNWREAVDEFFNSIAEEHCIADLRDSILHACENGTFNKRDKANAPFGLSWSVEPYDYCGGGVFIYVQAPKSISES